MNDSSFPKRQLLALAIAASCAAASAPGWAQQAAPPAPANAAPANAPQTDASQTGAPQQATDLDKVTVTGYRYSIEQSLDQKREANAVVEVVTAEDVGKFPDKNVADALQRVPGVIITRDGGEGKNVSVRGLSSELTLTELNGNYVASAETNGDPTRSFNYTLLPSNMLSSAELFKTPEARLDEGGIGGTVILHTRRPLEQEANTGFVSAEGTWADTTKKTDGQFSGSYSWHDKDDRFGVFVGYTQQKRTVRTLGVDTSAWNWYSDDNEAHPATDVNGKPSNFDSYWWGESGFYDQNGKYYTNFMMPNVVNFKSEKEERERKGGQITLQFKPTDDLTFTANYFRFDMDRNSQTNTLSVPEWNLARYSGDGNWPGGRLLDGLTMDPSGTVVTGAQYSVHPNKTYYCSEAAAAAGGMRPGGWGPDDCTIPTPWLTGSYNREKARSQMADFELAWTSERLDIAVKAGRTWADGGPQVQMTMPVKPRLPTTAGSNGTTVNGTGAYTLGNYYTAWDLTGTPSLQVSPELMNNLRNGIGEIDLGSTGSSWTRKQHLAEVRAERLHLARRDRQRAGLDPVRHEVPRRWQARHASRQQLRGLPGRRSVRLRTAASRTAAIRPPRCSSRSFLYPEQIGNIAGAFNTNAFPAINYPAYIYYLNKTYGPMPTRRKTTSSSTSARRSIRPICRPTSAPERLRGKHRPAPGAHRQHADSTDRVDY